MRTTFILGEAALTLYAADGDGAPVVASPLWSGTCQNQFRHSENWMGRETRPTGAAYPVSHPLVARHSLRIGRTWALDMADMAGWRPAADQTYVLDVLFREDPESGERWHRKVFYGVKIDARSFAAPGPDTGAEDEQEWSAQYCVESGGVSGEPPALAATVPYVVNYVDATGVTALYSYAQATHTFTATASTTGRATLLDGNGELHVVFSGDSGASVSVADGELDAPGMFQSNPGPAVPRLEFWVAGVRVATVTRAGLWSAGFTEGTPTDAARKFAFYHGAGLVATFAESGVAAGNWDVE